MSKTYAYQATVVKIIDGDTIDCDVDVGFNVYIRARFRINNYNAPENSGDEKPMGLQAKTYLTLLLQQYPNVVLKTYKGDAFGRWLCDILLPTTEDVATKLVIEGYGKHWDGKGTRPTFNIATYPMNALG